MRLKRLLSPCTAVAAFVAAVASEVVAVVVASAGMVGFLET